VAEWLAAQGAQHLVLVGRSAATEAGREAVRKLEDAGVQVVVAQADVSQKDQVARVLAEIDEKMPPLRGVVHAAGVLDDGVLLQQDWERFARVMAPKVDGAWNLNHLTKDRELDFFVLFSSTASLLGPPGQGNYAAANAFMDALAHWRQAQGLPALSINWGPWAEVGMAATVGDRGQHRLSEQGMSFISPAQGVQILGQLLPQASPQVAVLPMDWAKYCRFYPAARELPLLTHLAQEAKIPANGDTPVAAPQALSWQAVMAVEPPERQRLLETAICTMAAQVLRLPATSLDVQQPLNNLGLDSLMAVELFTKIQKAFGQTLPLATTLGSPTVEQLANTLANIK
jgi:myxalamid-type polyketide synthase MxaE and MxaD